MEKITLYKHIDKINGSFYWYKSKEGYLLEDLVFYLQEVEEDPDWWLKILENPSIPSAEGNMMILEKENGKLYIWNSMYKGPEDRDPDAFETTIPELKRIIKEWLTLLKEGPDEIIFTYEKGKVKLAGA